MKSKIIKILLRSKEYKIDKSNTISALEKYAFKEALL